MPLSHKDTRMHKEKFKPLSDEEERTGKLIVNAAYIVHKSLGPGLLERFMKFASAMFYRKMAAT